MSAKTILFSLMTITFWFAFGCASTLQSPVDEWKRDELYFGSLIPGGGTVNDELWNRFVDSIITPRFPSGITILNADGRYRYNDGVILNEPTRIVILLYNDSLEIRNAAIEHIMDAYIQKFHQEAVLRTTNTVNVQFRK